VANSTEQLYPPAEKKTLWAWTLGTFFGAGFLKPGPGTYGSIAALLLWFGAAHAFQPAPAALAIATTIAAIALTLIGIPAATIVARESGGKDPGLVVIDEAAGQLIALIAIPADWRHAALSLLLSLLLLVAWPVSYWRTAVVSPASNQFTSLFRRAWGRGRWRSGRRRGCRRWRRGP